MKKKLMQFITVSLSAVLLSTCLFACDLDKGTKNANLINWKNTTETVEYGSEYQLKKYVYDDKGTAYNVTANVMVGEVSVDVWDYTFTVSEYKTYTVQYSTSATDETVKTTLNVSDRVEQEFVLSSSASSGTQLSQNDVEALELGGKYQGAAYRYTFGVTASGKQTVAVPFSYQQCVEAKEQGHTAVSFYVATQSENDKAVRISSRKPTASKSLLAKDYTPVLSKWMKISLDLETLTTMLFKDGNVQETYFFGAYMSTSKRVNADGTPTKATVYVGEMFFDDATKVFPIEDKEILYIHNQLSVDRFSNGYPAHKKTFVSAEEMEDFDGNYEGSAVRYDMPIGTTSVNIVPRITEAQYDAYLAEGYTKLYFWVAAYADNGKTMKVRSDNSMYKGSIVSLINKTWKKITITLSSESKAELFDLGKLFGVYMSPADRLNADGSQTTMHWYIGNIGFEEKTAQAPAVKSDEFVFVYNDTATDNFTFYGSDKGEYVKGSTLGFAGEYTGDAVSYESTSVYAVIVKPTSRITESEYDALLAAGYTKLCVWVAAYADNGKTVKITADESLYNKSAVDLTDKTWTKLTFALTNVETDTTISSANYANVDFQATYGVADYAAYVKKMLFADGGARLFRFYMSPSDRMNEDETNTGLHCYVGNVGFEK